MGAPGSNLGDFLGWTDRVFHPPLQAEPARPEPPGPDLRHRRTRRALRVRGGRFHPGGNLGPGPDDHRRHPGLRADLGQEGSQPTRWVGCQTRTGLAEQAPVSESWLPQVCAVVLEPAHPPGQPTTSERCYHAHAFGYLSGAELPLGPVFNYNGLNSSSRMVNCSASGGTSEAGSRVIRSGTAWNRIRCLSGFRNHAIPSRRWPSTVTCPVRPSSAQVIALRVTAYCRFL